MKKMVDILGDHAFFQELSQEHLAFIAGCGKNVIFEEKQIIAKPGDTASEFYLIRHGQAALILEDPPHPPFIYKTLSENEILGLNWLLPPYRWTVTVQAIQPLRVIAIEGTCFWDKCEKDPILGFQLMKHLVKVLVNREEEARLHLLDVYGTKNG